MNSFNVCILMCVCVCVSYHFVMVEKLCIIPMNLWAMSSRVVLLVRITLGEQVSLGVVLHSYIQARNQLQPTKEQKVCNGVMSLLVCLYKYSCNWLGLLLGEGMPGSKLSKCEGVALTKGVCHGSFPLIMWWHGRHFIYMSILKHMPLATFSWRHTQS